MTRPSSQIRLLFVTSSFRTRWEAYSQALIRASGLAHRILVVDGRSRWHPLNFVEASLEFESDYIVHVDEDAFLLDPGQLSALIAELQADPKAAVAGVPDGSTPYRSHNPYACNLFFAVFKTAALRESIRRRPDWRSLRFDPAFIRHLSRPPATTGACALDDFEPYYPIFWLLLDQGWHIRYLPSSFRGDSLGSEVALPGARRPMVWHAWHLRKWFSREPDPEIGMSPAEKYKQIGSHLNRLVVSRPLLAIHFARALFRLVRARRARA